MEKIIRVGKGSQGNVYCKISFKDGRLSISGVEGPTRGGNCKGSCGQIVMHKWDISEYAPGFNAEVEAKLRDYWDKWHLNDMQPNCVHQVGPEWESKDVTIYRYTLTLASLEKSNAAKRAAEAALKRGETFTPTAEQTAFANLPYMVKTHSAEAPPHYEAPKKTAHTNPVEVKKTNWCTEEEHPEGFLSKACPVCGYKYGSKWLKKEVPQEVIDFLFSLPDTDMKPAWV